VRGS
jgi:energy-coupling factor transporter ATP-binding protein EcfA2